MKKFLSFFTIFSLFLVIFAGSLSIAPAFAMAKSGRSEKPLYAEADADTETAAKQYGVITVKFSDQTEDAFSEDFNDLLMKTLKFSPQSVKNYFLEASNGKYLTDFTLLTDTPIVLDEPQSYYMPKYITTVNGYKEANENGYDNRYFDLENNPCPSEKSGVKRHIDRLLREQSLIRSVIKGLSETTLNLDGDNNGLVDGLVIIFGDTQSSGGWDEILWEHRSNLTVYNEQKLKNDYYIPGDYELSALDFLPCYINAKAADNYTVFRSSKITEHSITDENDEKLFSCGAICHELMHDTGIADYYPYAGEDEPVGELDIMGGISILPSMPLTYTRYRLGWLNDGAIIPAEKSGAYTLYPVTSDSKVKAVKLVLNDYYKTGEYFMIEARSKDSSLADGGLSSSGIVVYRVNEKNGYIGADLGPSTVNYGNMYGDNEVFIYRLGDEKLYSEKEKSSYAILNGSGKIKHDTHNESVDNSTIGNPDKSAYKTVIGPNGQLLTSLYYSDGTNSGIVITDITLTNDGSYSFNLSFDDADATAEKAAEISKYFDGKTSVVNWRGGKREGQVTIYACGAEDFTKYKNGRYVLKKKVTLNDLESGAVYGNPVTYNSESTASYSRAFLPQFDQMTAVFVAFGDGDVIFAGVVNPRTPTFKEYLFGTTKWLAAIIGIVVLAIVAVAVVIFVIVKKGRQEAKKEDEDDNSEYTALYGENYWMQGVDSENETTEDSIEDETPADENDSVTEETAGDGGNGDNIPENPN